MTAQVVGRHMEIAPGLAGGELHAGIVSAPQHRSICALIKDTTLTHSVLDAEEIARQIEFLWQAPGADRMRRGTGVRSHSLLYPLEPLGRSALAGPNAR